MPGFLCRVCHPRIVIEPKEKATVHEPDVALMRHKLLHEHAKLQRKYDTERIRLDSMVATYGNAAKTAIEKQRAKVARLAKRLEG